MLRKVANISNTVALIIWVMLILGTLVTVRDGSQFAWCLGWSLLFWEQFPYLVGRIFRAIFK